MPMSNAEWLARHRARQWGKLVRRLIALAQRPDGDAIARERGVFELTRTAARYAAQALAQCEQDRKAGTRGY